jgi:hypothetical protein
MHDLLRDPDESAGPRFEIDNVAEFIAFLIENDAYDICDHERLWTRCWECGHFEDYLDDVDAASGPD